MALSAYWLTILHCVCFLQVCSVQSDGTETVVPPTTISIKYNGVTYYDGGSISVVAGDGRRFTCKTPGVYPETTFTWTLPSSITAFLPWGITTFSKNTDGTVDSSNVRIVSIAENPATSQLKCGATNRQDGLTLPTIRITVTLQIKVPPKEVKLLQSGSEVGDLLTVSHDRRYTVQCSVTGTRPAASIQWLVSNAVPSTGVAGPTSYVRRGLSDTLGSWTFTATRTHHRQVVKCTASTHESTLPLPKDKTTIDVIVPPNIITIGYNDVIYNDGGYISVVAGDGRQFTCYTPDVYPKTTFTWTLPSSITTDQPLGTTYSTNADYTVDSSNMIIVSIAETPGTPQLTCGATNRQDGSTQPEISITVTLQIKVPPKEVQLLQNDTEVGSLLTVEHGTQYTLQCSVQGTRPAATIQWLVHNAMPSTGVADPTSSLNNSLYDTLGSWSFTAARTHHQQEVKCVANTDESPQPYPEDTTTVIFRGRPDSPTNVTVTEKTPASITVSWAAGYDGGEDQWFIVSHLKSNSDDTEEFSDRIFGGENMYRVTCLGGFTEYEIRVYAENKIVRNINYGAIMVTTPPTRPIGVPLWFYTSERSVRVEWFEKTSGCIKLEVKYTDRPEWIQCGECIDENRLVQLSEWCAHSSSRRNRRGAQDIDEVRARRCHGDTCSQPLDVTQVASPSNCLPSNLFGVVIGVEVALVLCTSLLGFMTGKQFCSRTKEDPAGDMSKVLVGKHIEMQSRAPKYKPNDQEITSEVRHEVTTAQCSATYGNVSVAHRAFPRDQLKVIRELGHGAFGLVLLADAVGIVEKSKVTAVAVKTVKGASPESSKTDFMRELELMRILPDHPNVVKLLGFCIEEDPLYIIVEFLSKGNLKDLLEDSRRKGGRVYGNLHGASNSLSSNDLMKFAKDVADGMAFISSQKCIHRDLAARNVLVSENLTCKVSDFGLARDVMDVRVYERGKDEKLPLRWMALESFFDNVYTTMSDVWSYGVLLWEIVTLGSRPYPEMTAKTMISKLKMGYRMPKPLHCQQALYEIMSKTWSRDPEDRPTFEMLSKNLETLMDTKKEYIKVDYFKEDIYEAVTPKDENEKV